MKQWKLVAAQRKILQATTISAQAAAAMEHL
jgi:hypothetical protein